MNGFLEWVGATCAVAAVCTLVHTLVDKKGVGKVCRLLTSAVTVCVILSPFADMVKDFTLPQIETFESENALYDTAISQMQAMTETLLLAEINEALASHNLKAEKVELSMDISADGNISITDIRLYIPEGNALHRTWVAQIAKTRLGREVTVEFLQGG